jgi:hypothetical protein
LDITVIFENLPRVSNSPLGEKSPNLVTLISTLDFVPGGKIRLVNQVCGKKINISGFGLVRTVRQGDQMSL